MKNLEFIKKWYLEERETWIKEDGEEVVVIEKTMINGKEYKVQKYDIYEKIEPVVINGIEYVYFGYVMGEGYVIRDNNQSHDIRLMDLVNNDNRTFYEIEKEEQEEIENKRLQERKNNENIEKERIENLKETAKTRGVRQEISKWSEECNDENEDCDIDNLVEYVNPDGTFTVERYHTW